MRIDEQEDYNGARVLATPNKTPQVHKAKTNQDLGTLYSYFQHWYGVLQTIDKKLSSISEKEKYIIWGAGLHTEFLFNKTSFFRGNRQAKFLFFDSDPAKIGGTYRGIPIVAPFSTTEEISVDTPIVISSYRGSEVMKKQCIKHGWSENNIISFYDHYKLY